MALHENLVTQQILKEGVVFRLSADGLDRTYQVELGTVLWSLPKALDAQLRSKSRLAGTAGPQREGQDSPRGIQYTEKLRSSTTTYHVAVTADLQADLPTLPHLLRTLAQYPSGCVKLYLKPKKLCKFFKKHAKGTPRLVQRCCVLCRPGEEKDVICLHIDFECHM